MTDLEQLISQRAELDARIEAAQREARDSAIAQVRELMSRHNLTLADINSRPQRVSVAKTGKSGRSGGKVPAKYRDAAGNSWSGRGLKPKWLTAAMAGGARLDDFAI